MASRTLPGLGLKGFWLLGEDNWKDENDLNLLVLSALVQPRVLEIVAADPGAPADGDIYYFDDTHPTHPEVVAIRDNGGWAYIAAFEGMELYNVDDGKKYRFSGGTLAEIAGAGAGLGAAVDTDIWTGTSTTDGITPDALFDAAKVQALVDGATITPDFGAGLNFSVTLGGNRTLANPTNAKEGQSGVIHITQDGTGNRTLAYGSNWRFPGGSAVGGLLSTAAGSVDLLSYFVRAGGTISATLSKALAA